MNQAWNWVKGEGERSGRSRVLLVNCPAGGATKLQVRGVKMGEEEGQWRAAGAYR